MGVHRVRRGSNGQSEANRTGFSLVHSTITQDLCVFVPHGYFFIHSFPRFKVLSLPLTSSLERSHSLESCVS